MNVTRRQFLASAAAVPLASMLLSHSALAQTMILDLPEVMHRADFEARIKDWFYVFNADATQQSNLQLVEIRDENSNSRVEQYTLLFRSDRMDTPIRTGLYEVAGERFGMFLQHTREFKGWQYYRSPFAKLR